MSEDAERVGAFLLLFAATDVPLLGLVALPDARWTPAAAAALVGLSWAGVGVFLVASARAEVQPRGVIDGIWVATTLTPPVAILALAEQAPGGLPGSAWVVPGSAGTAFLLVAFWVVYALGGEAGPFFLRWRRKALAGEDGATLGAVTFLPLGVGLGLALAGVRPPDGVLAGLFVGVPAVVVLGAQWLGGRRRRRAWSALASDLGFSRSENHLRFPDLVGAVDGRACRLRLESRRARHLTYWRTEVALKLDEAPEAELHLAPETRLSRLQKALGARDAELGRAGLDEAVLAEADNPDLARRLLEAAARARDEDGGFRPARDDLPRAWGRLAEVELEGSRLVARLPGVAGARVIRETLDLVTPMAEAAEGAARERAGKEAW